MVREEGQVEEVQEERRKQGQRDSLGQWIWQEIEFSWRFSFQGMKETLPRAHLCS